MGKTQLNAAAPLLSVAGLRITFPTPEGPVAAVDEVSFTIAAGEILGVAGESGAGKSLTAAAVIGLLPPPGRIAGGEIRLEGERLDTLEPDAMRRVRGARIGAIFQDPLGSLDPLFSIGDQLIETISALTHASRAQARDRAVALLTEVGIPSPARHLRSYPHQFSGGMRQRAVIALALAGNPRLIIADEPTTALDVSVQTQILSTLKRLCRQHGVAVMLVTHDIGVIAGTADRLAVIYAGRIVELGPTSAVLRAPQHPYTAALLRSIPRVGGDRAKLRHIEGAMPPLAKLPPGCAFHPRCDRAWEQCRTSRPELLAAGAGMAACWLHG